MKYAFFSTIILFAIITVARPAPACSPPGCMPAVFWPHWEEGQDLPSVPENLARVWIRYWGLGIDGATLAGIRLRNGQETTFELQNEEGVVALPEAQEGDEWTVEEEHSCPQYGMGPVSSRVRLRIGAAEPLPAALGVLRASPVRREEVGVKDYSGPCSSRIDAAVVDVSIDFAEEILPYRAILRYETTVDGEVWDGTSSIVIPYDEGETARIFVACQEPTEFQDFPRLAEGTHVIRRMAYLPGVAEPIASDEISVDIRCDAINPEPSRKKSSGCQASPARPASGPALFLLLLAWGLFSRRRIA